MIAPAALASAVEDALAPLGVSISELPMTPERLAMAVEVAQGRG
jgi:CO/xanthine dehydrogenase Mo-binding subunit